MKWEGGRKSGNVNDKRGMSTGGKLTLAGGGIIVLIVGLLMGGDPAQLLNQMMTEGGQPTQTEYQSTPEEDRLFNLSEVVLASTEDVWKTIFKENGMTYVEPKLDVYNSQIATQGCGTGLSSYSPFYCPADQTVYLDLSFNEQLQKQFGSKGDFAISYVIAHEVGHHIQNSLGVLDKLHKMRGKVTQAEYNRYSVMTELQADYYAGVWAHYLNQLTDIIITYDNILEGMRTAAAVGDDRIQEQSGRTANPESFTHGTAKQRSYWFNKGHELGTIEGGNTFDDPELKRSYR